MRILFLTNLYPPIYGGGYELECRDIAEGLVARGHEATVVTSMRGVESPQVDGNVHRVMRFLGDEVKAEDYADKIVHLATYLKAQMRLASICRHNARAVKAVIDQVRPDVAYVWNLDDVTLSPLVAISEHDIPRVHRLGAMWMANALAYHLTPERVRRVVRGILRGVRNPEFFLKQGSFITCSDFIGRQAVEAGLPKENVFTVYTFVPIPTDLPPLYDGPVFRMLYGGRVCEEKGVHVAVQATGELARDSGIGPFELSIVGSGPQDYISRLKKEVADLGIADRVRFVGFVPREQLLSMMPESHVWLFTSIWAEPFGQVLTESMGRGLPIIASPVGGSAEFLVDGENALTFPSGDHKALAAAVKRLMNDRSLRARLREGGSRTVRERFGFKKTIDMHEHYLLAAVGKTAISSVATEVTVGKS
jgi:glycogen synthase